MRNRYLLILNNNYTGQKFLFETFNITTDPNYYKFNLEIPAELQMPYGEYDYFLIRCELNYDIKFSHNLIDSELTVTDLEGNNSTWKLRDLPCETGILSFEPDRKDGKYEYLDIDNDKIIVDIM